MRMRIQVRIAASNATISAIRSSSVAGNNFVCVGMLVWATEFEPRYG